MQHTDSLISELNERLARYPAARYPVQHATAQFHIGTIFTNDGRLEEAESALRAAIELFAPSNLSVERAKSLNALGAVLRLQGRLDEAARAFEVAFRLFEQSDAPLESGAAAFNLGLTARDRGNGEIAIESFKAAQALLKADGVRPQAAAAARELGATYLMVGDHTEAIAALEESVDLAKRFGEQADIGAAANALGLAQLAANNPLSAASSFRTAAAANPKMVRPEAYAMAKVNLALAYEQAEEPARSRLAARQALKVTSAAEVVRAQASGILARLGHPTDDLLQVLKQEDQDHWPGIIRQELAWWDEADFAELGEEAKTWLLGLVDSGEHADSLAEAWVAVLLEQSPAQMERVISLVLEASRAQPDATRTSFQSLINRTMPRFHAPQYMRLKDSFSSIARRLDLEGWE